jgi:chemotaxis protein MotA
VKAFSAIGIAVCIGGLFLGATMEGSNVMAVLSPSAMAIVLVGTLGASMAGASFEAIKAIPKLIQKAFLGEAPDMSERLSELVGYAEKARRDGLLALDEQVGSIEDDFTRKGLQMVVDGTDPDVVTEILELENDNMKKRHKNFTQPFEKAGGYAPTMGIIGTVFGLIHVLENLSSPETLGPSISAAFVATLLGIASANVFYLPMAARLKGMSEQEHHFRAMTIEGILAIQAGENPRTIAEKLITFIPPAQRPSADEAASGGSAAASDKKAASDRSHGCPRPT